MVGLKGLDRNLEVRGRCWLETETARTLLRGALIWPSLLAGAQAGCSHHSRLGPTPCPSAHPRPTQTLAEVCALCTDARIEYKAGHHKAVGQPTEAALLVLAEKLGVASEVAQKGIRALRLADPEANPAGACQHHAAKWRKLATLEFDRDRKARGDREGCRRGFAGADQSKSCCAS